mmetsp:Transcript_31843/g.60851  ORF Transcript_31843/g.60851 Transcript_31843/m.60851 type:complete len:124 (+) Transcript_31843:3352-3723(+)
MYRRMTWALTMLGAISIVRTSNIGGMNNVWNATNANAFSKRLSLLSTFAAMMMVEVSSGSYMLLTMLVGWRGRPEAGDGVSTSVDSGLLERRARCEICAKFKIQNGKWREIIQPVQSVQRPSP